MTAEEFYYAPLGTPRPASRAELNAPDSPWKALGAISVNPISDALKEVGEAADQARTVLADFSRSFEMQFSKFDPRAFRRCLGVYRLPGGKPLIHKGRAWR